MTTALVAPVLPPYRDGGGVLTAAMVATAALPVDCLITAEPTRFRHLDPTLLATDDPLASLRRLSRELTSPPETRESLDEFVAMAQALAPADLLHVWGCSASRHSLEAAVALAERNPGSTLGILVPTWPADLKPLRGESGDLPAAAAWAAIDRADVLLSGSPAITRALNDRWAETPDAPTPTVRTLDLGPARGAASAPTADRTDSPALRILHVDNGSGPGALAQLGQALALLPAPLARTITVDVIGERPPETSAWLPTGSPVTATRAVVTEQAARQALRQASDLVYVVEPPLSDRGPSVDWTWVEGSAGRPLLAVGPRDGVLHGLLGRPPVPVSHPTALAYAVASASAPRVASLH